MANDKILAFRVNVTGTSEEAQGIAKIDAAMQKLNKTRTQLLKKQRDGIGLTQNETKALAKTGSSIEDLKNKKNQLVKVERQASREFTAQAGSMAQLRARTSKLRAEMERLNLNTAQGRARQKEMGREVLSNTKKIRDYDRQMSGSSTLVGEYSKGIINAFQKIAGGIFVAITAIRTLTRVLTQATNEFKEFEKGQANVQTLLERTDSTLEGKSIKLMKTYGLQVGDLNKSLFDAVSAGVDASKSVEFLDTATRLAIGGVTDLNIAVDGITTIINSYGKSVEESEQIAAAFFSAQKFGKTTVGELASEIGNVAPIAAQVDVTYQELLTTYASLTKQGIKTQQSTTAIRSILTALIKPSVEAKKAFNELGIETGAAAIKQNGLYKTLVQVSEAAEKDADVLSELIPSVEALTGIGALGTRQLKEYSEMLQTVNEDYGEGSSLARAYTMQSETLDKTMGRISAAFRARKIEMGRFFQPLIESFADIVAPVETLTDKLNDQRQQVSLLTGELLNSNIEEGRRLEIINELNRISPDILRNIDTEAINMKALSDNVAEYNRQMAKRIALAGLEEEEQKLLGKQGSRYAEIIMDQNQSLTFLNSALSDYKQALGDAVPEQVLDGFEQLRGLVESTADEAVKYDEFQKYFDQIRTGLQGTDTDLDEVFDAWNEMTRNQFAVLSRASVNYANFVDKNKDKLDELNRAQETILKGLGGEQTTTETPGGGETKQSRVLKPFEIDETGLPTVKSIMDEAVKYIDQSYQELADNADAHDKLMWKRLKLKMQREDKAEEEAKRKKIQADQDILQSKLQTMDAIARTTEAVTQLFFINAEKEIKAAEGNEEMQDQIRRKYYRREQVASSLTAGINTAVAITKAMSQTGVLSPLVIPALVAQGLAAQIAIWAKKYETGGMVAPGNEMPGAPKSGDNTLAMVKPGEVILNENQQQALGGYEVFKRIGVPGFAAGGVVQTPIAPTQSGGIYDQQFNILAERIISGFNDKSVVLKLSELEEAQDERAIVTQSRGL
jgi:TP901 family phage tail tape measure protein